MNDSNVNITFEGSAAWELSPLDICTFVISLLFGFPTHFYVLWLIVIRTGSGVASEFFNLNLSVCEIGISLNSVLSAIAYFTGFQHLTLLTLFLLGLMISGRPLFQCLICVERYLAVVHPVTFLKSKPLRYRLICCAVVWILAFGSCFVTMFTQGILYIYSWFFSLQFLLFLSIQLFCLVAVLRALKQSGPGEKGGKEDAENHMKRTAFYVILITTVSTTGIYVPFTISGFFYIVSNSEMYIPELFHFGLICFILAGFFSLLFILIGLENSVDSSFN